MRSCLHSVSLPDLPVLDVLRRAAAAGYRGVELNAETLPWAGPHVTPATSADVRAAIVAEAGRLDLALPALGAHIGMVDEDPAARRAALDFVLGCIDLAADLGVPVVHVLSGPLAAPGGSREQAWGWFANAVAAATDHAGRAGIALGVEAIAGHLFHGADDYHRLARDLAGVPFRVNFDPSHLIVQGEVPRRIVDELADRIVHIHLKDGAGRYPAFAFPPLGRGEIDFPGLIDGLRRAGYEGALSVEYEAQVYGYALSEDAILETGRAFLSGLEVS
jgi:sugar phosphate isomerase/epimerase